MNTRLGLAWPLPLASGTAATLFLPLLFVGSVTVVDVLVDLPAVAMTALLIVAITASVATAGRSGGFIGLGASVAMAALHLATLDLITLAGAGAGVVAIIAPLRDAISRSDEVRRASADAREWLRQIVDRLADPVVVWDRSGRIAFVNESAITLIGKPPADAIDVARVLRGEDVRVPELRVQDAHGNEHILVVAATPLRGGDEIIGAVATFSDVTEIKSLEQERSDFYAMLGHEIRTPLTAVTAQAQLLRRMIERGAPNDRLRTIAIELDSGIARMRSLTAEVGELMTLRAGSFDLTPRDVDLRVIVQSALARNSARTDRHTLAVVLPESEVIVSCDEFRVEQVFDNIIANAIHYSPAGGCIRLELTLEAPVAVVRLTDEGMGIPPSERARIFEPFYRASNARSRRGTGLGLAISRDIMRRSGGDIWLEQSGERGSTFAVKLPLATSAKPETAPAH